MASGLRSFVAFTQPAGGVPWRQPGSSLAFFGRLASCAALAIAVALGPTARVSAAEYRWDPNGSATDEGGNGTWDTTSSFWRLATPTGTLGPWPNNLVTPDTAVFGGTAGTVTIADGVTITAGSLRIGTTGYVIGRTGTGSLTLAGTLAGRVDVTAGTTTISAPIAGSVGLTKTSGGTLRLSGSSDYSGETAVNGGILVVAGNSALGATGASNGTVVSNNTRMILADGVTVTGESLTINGAGGSGYFFGSLQTEAGTAEWAGPVTIGTSGETRIGALSGSTLRISGVIADASSGTPQPLRIRSGDSDFGVVEVSAANTYTTGTLVMSGTLRLAGGDNRLPIGTAVTLGVSTVSGTLDLGGTNQTATSIGTNGTGSQNQIGNSSTTADSTLTIAPGAGTTVSFSGGIVDAIGGGTRKTGISVASGTLSLSGAYAYTGGTTVASGASLSLGRTGSYAFDSLISGGGAVTFANGAPLVSQASTFSGGATIASGTGAVRLAASSIESGGTVLSGPVGTGTLTINGGFLTAADAGTPRTLHNPITVGGDFTLGSTAAEFAAPLTLAGPITLTGTRTITASAPATIMGVIGDGGGGHGLTKSGTGTLTLSAQNTYGGGTTVSAGTLLLAGGNDRLPIGTAVTLGVSTVSGTLDLGGTNQTATSIGTNGTGSQNQIGNSSTTADSTLTIAPGAGTTVSFSGGIVDAIGGGTRKTGISVASGTLSLSGAYAYTGGTALAAGTRLSLGRTGDYAFGSTISGPGQVVLADGNVTLGQPSTFAGGFTMSVGAVRLALSSVESAGTVLSGPVGTGTFTVNGGFLTAADAGTPRTLHNAVTVGGDFTLGSTAAEFAAPLTLAGPVTLTGTRTITVSAPATIMGVIGDGGGGHGLTKSGTGTLTLSAQNTYGGGTTVSAGTLLLAGGNDRLPTAAAISVTGGVLDLGGSGQTTSGNLSVSGGSLTGGSLSIAGTITLSGGTISATSITNAGTGAFAISGGGTIPSILASTAASGLTKTGNNTLTLTGANTYAGVTTVNAGSLVVASNSALGAAGVGNEVSVANTAAVLLAAGVTVSGKSISLVGSGGTEVTGALRAASGTATWAGDVTLPTTASGAPRVGAGSAADPTSTLVISGVVSGGSLAHGFAIRPFTTNAAVVGQNGGTVVLSGANTYAGPTAVVTGALVLADGDNRLPTTTILNIGNVGNVSWASADLGGTNQALAGLRSAGVTMPMVLTNSSATASLLMIGRTVDEGHVYDGVISGNLAVTKTGSNRLQLGGANTYTGTTTLNAGILRIGPSVGTVGAITSSGVGTGPLVLNGGTFTSSTGTARTILNPATLGGNLDLGAASPSNGLLDFAAATTLTGTRSLTLASDVTFSGAVGESGGSYGLTKAGTGLLTLAGTNTYTGTTTVSAGTVSIGDGTITGSVAGPIAVASGSTIRFATAAATPQTYAGAISGAGSLEKTAAGTLTLSGTNTYAGGTSITAGVIVFDTLAAIGGTGANVAVSTGATAGLVAGDFEAFLGRINTASTGTIALAASSSTAINLGLLPAGASLGAVGNITYSGALTPAPSTYRLGGLSGTLTLDQAGQITGGNSLLVTGNVALAAPMDYTGTTTVEAGTLSLVGGVNRLPATAAVTLGTASGSGTLDLAGSAQTLSGITIAAGGGTIGNSSTTADSVLSIAAGTSTVAFAGTIVDALGAGSRTTALTVASGTLTVTGTQTYTGATTVAAGARLDATNATLAGNFVNAGTLVLGGFSSTATIETSGPVTLAGNAGDYAVDGVISGTGSLAPAAGVPIISGPNTFSGGFTLSSSAVRVGASSVPDGSTVVSGPLGTGTVTLTGGTLTANTAADTRTLHNPVTLGGNVSLGSTVSTRVGPLQFAGPLTLTGTRTLTIQAPVEITGTIGESGGTFGLTKAGAATLTLSSPAAYGGTTTVTAGTLLLSGGNNRLPTAAAITVSGGSLDLGGTSQATSGAITISGGTLANGTLTSSGTITISGGTVANGTLTSTVSAFAGQSGTVSANLAGSVGLSKTTTNTLTISGPSSYSGVTTVSAGAIRLQPGGTLGSTAAGTTVAIGARVELAGGATVTGETLTMAGTGGNNFGGLQSQSGDNTWAGAITLSTPDSSGNRIGGLLGTTLRVSGPISGTGPLILRAEGTVTSTAIVEFSGANSYSGGTVIYAGTLRLAGGDNRLPTSGGLTIGLSASNLYGDFDLGGFNQTVASLASVGNNVALQTIGNSSTTADSTLTVNLASGSNTYGAQLRDSINGGTRKLGLTKSGAGTLVISGGSNTFSGATRLDGGVLQVGNALALQNSTVDTRSGSAGSLSFGTQTAATFGGLTGSNNLALQNASSAAVALTVGGNGESTTFGGILSGAGSLTKAGLSTLTLNGASTYAGATAINAGTLVAGHANAFGTTGSITIGDGAVLGIGPGVSFARPLTIPGTGRVSAGDNASVILPSVAALSAWESRSPAVSGTFADVLYGDSLDTSARTLASSWTANPGTYLSDILSLDGTGAATTFVLSMTYTGNPDPASLNVWYRETVGDSFAPLGTAYQGVGAWTSGFTTRGQYGVDTTAGSVWVVTDHNSQFVVVPEPGSIVVCGVAALAGLLLARRRRGSSTPG